MAELESSLTTIDWLMRLRVGITGDQCSWSDTNGTYENGTVNGTEADGDRNRKPAYSYSSLIYLAIGSKPERKMTLSEIYAWICDRFPYYKTADSGWKVSTYVGRSDLGISGDT